MHPVNGYEIQTGQPRKFFSDNRQNMAGPAEYETCIVKKHPAKDILVRNQVFTLPRRLD